MHHFGDIDQVKYNNNLQQQNYQSNSIKQQQPEVIRVYVTLKSAQGETKETNKKLILMTPINQKISMLKRCVEQEYTDLFPNEPTFICAKLQDEYGYSLSNSSYVHELLQNNSRLFAVPEGFAVDLNNPQAMHLTNDPQELLFLLQSIQQSITTKMTECRFRNIENLQEVLAAILPLGFCTKSKIIVHSVALNMRRILDTERLYIFDSDENTIVFNLLITVLNFWIGDLIFQDNALLSTVVEILEILIKSANISNKLKTPIIINSLMNVSKLEMASAQTRSRIIRIISYLTKGQFTDTYNPRPCSRGIHIDLKNRQQQHQEQAQFGGPDILDQQLMNNQQQQQQNRQQQQLNINTQLENNPQQQYNPDFQSRVPRPVSVRQAQQLQQQQQQFQQNGGNSRLMNQNNNGNFNRQNSRQSSRHYNTQQNLQQQQQQQHIQFQQNNSQIPRMPQFNPNNNNNNNNAEDLNIQKYSNNNDNIQGASEYRQKMNEQFVQNHNREQKYQPYLQQKQQQNGQQGYQSQNPSNKLNDMDIDLQSDIHHAMMRDYVSLLVPESTQDMHIFAVNNLGPVSDSVIHYIMESPEAYSRLLNLLEIQLPYEPSLQQLKLLDVLSKNLNPQRAKEGLQMKLLQRVLKAFSFQPETFQPILFELLQKHLQYGDFTVDVPNVMELVQCGYDKLQLMGMKILTVISDPNKAKFTNYDIQFENYIKQLVDYTYDNDKTYEFINLSLQTLSNLALKDSLRSQINFHKGIEMFLAHLRNQSNLEGQRISAKALLNCSIGSRDIKMKIVGELTEEIKKMHKNELDSIVHGYLQTLIVSKDNAKTIY